jgi:hypothetical protein
LLAAIDYQPTKKKRQKKQDNKEQLVSRPTATTSRDDWKEPSPKQSIKLEHNFGETLSNNIFSSSQQNIPNDTPRRKRVISESDPPDQSLILN